MPSRPEPDDDPSAVELDAGAFTNRRGEEVSSIARATAVTLPDTRSAKITYSAEYVARELSVARTLICEYRSSGLRSTNEPGASTIAFKVNR